MYYVLSMAAFYCWHYCAHQPFSGDMYRIHLHHHVKPFPAAQFYGVNPDLTAVWNEHADLHFAVRWTSTKIFANCQLASIVIFVTVTWVCASMCALLRDLDARWGACRNSRHAEHLVMA